MELRTLADTPVPDIINAFNEAFSDYFIRLQLTDETMAAKIKSENILLRHSVGAFEDGRLVGFILHGYDVIDGVKTIYNAGTGVVPPFRGKGITAALYQYIIPVLQKEGISTHILEVIDNNYPAIKIYEQIGFKKIRTLSAFKSSDPIGAGMNITIKEIKNINEPARSFASMRPAWQNSLASMQRNEQGHQYIGAFVDEELMAYAVYVPATGRVKQCAVKPDYRRKGIGRALFHHMMQNSATGEITVTNLDIAYKPAVYFFEALGFKKLLGLYEMKMILH